MSLYRGDFESNVGRVVEAADFFVIFVWVSACERALPGDRIAVDTAETGGLQSFAPGGFLRNLRFRGVGVFALSEAKPNRIIHE